MAHLTRETPLVYAPDHLAAAPRRAAVQCEPTEDPHFDVRCPRPGPPGRSWLARVQVCRLQPAWGHFGIPAGHTRESLLLDKRVVLAWHVAERGWSFPGVAALAPEPGWTGLGDTPGRWTAARLFPDERAARLAYGLARLQLVSLAKRLRTRAVWRGCPDPRDLGDVVLDPGTLAWTGEGGAPHRGDLPGVWL